jgi:hypothetical protein
MPVSVVKTKEDEKAWKKAKKQAEKQGQGDNYAYIMSIYKNMTGYEAEDSKKKKKKESKLISYLHKRLTISLTEAILIESVVKSYIKNKKKIK